jgi:hypothetical protein
VCGDGVVLVLLAVGDLVVDELVEGELVFRLGLVLVHLGEEELFVEGGLVLLLVGAGRSAVKEDEGGDEPRGEG